jgi:hypothetical protein
MKGYLSPFLELQVLLLIHLQFGRSLGSAYLSLLSLIIHMAERGTHLVEACERCHHDLIFLIQNANAIVGLGLTLGVDPG